MRTIPAVASIRGATIHPAARFIGVGLTLAVLGFAGAAGQALAADGVAEDWTADLRREAETLGKPAWRPMLRYMAELHARATHPAAGPLTFDWEEIGHNPIFAMARLWQQAMTAPAPVPSPGPAASAPNNSPKAASRKD